MNFLEGKPLLNEKAEAVAHGAATIINAIAIGKGAAIGVDLWTKARVEITDKHGIIESQITSDPTENPILIEKTVLRVLEQLKLQEKLGAKVKTWSNIPIAKGLKSSSAAANAVTLATKAALNEELDDLNIVNLGVDAAINAKVTITGAFDDACASYFGGIVVTNNFERRILKNFGIGDDIVVLFYIPKGKAYTKNSNVRKMKRIAPLVKIAYKETLKGNFWAALTLNGLIYSSALGYNPNIAIEALMAGALASGLSGTGPAVTAIVKKEKIKCVEEAWQIYEGDILRANVNNEKAKVIG